MISLDSHNKPPTWHSGKYFPAEKWSYTEGKQAAQGHAPMVLQNQWRQRYLNLKETLPRSQEATKKTKQETLRVPVTVCLWALRGRSDASSPPRQSGHRNPEAPGCSPCLLAGRCFTGRVRRLCPVFCCSLG